MASWDSIKQEVGWLNGQYGTGVVYGGPVFDDIDQMGAKIASVLSKVAPDGWRVVYGGRPVQARHFTVVRGGGLKEESHPAQPPAKDRWGWHVNNLPELLQVLGITQEALEENLRD